MWIPATWTWRAALTCVLLETVLHGVRGRREHGAGRPDTERVLGATDVHSWCAGVQLQFTHLTAAIHQSVCTFKYSDSFSVSEMWLEVNTL